MKSTAPNAWFIAYTTDPYEGNFLDGACKAIGPFESEDATKAFVNKAEADNYFLDQTFRTGYFEAPQDSKFVLVQFSDDCRGDVLNVFGGYDKVMEAEFTKAGLFDVEELHNQEIFVLTIEPPSIVDTWIKPAN